MCACDGPPDLDGPAIGCGVDVEELGEQATLHIIFNSSL